MTTRIEPPLTRTRPGGPAAHVRSLGPVAAPVAPVPPETSEYIKYPRAAKAVFALAAATIVFAIVQSAAILVVTAWLLLVGCILKIGCRPDGIEACEVSIAGHEASKFSVAMPGDLSVESYILYGDHKSY